ncbi:flavodoxin family protein [Verminephrobacter aporrectodeae subsp. tuberculatae]|uniref:FMN dependent NADH:quinone oxidoreductase n=1 Tax=Verminephrobacter aporrectodeae subsp. tuberculatae TaxID=1110392 RepID=A0ABT3KVZ7_9BURK|nr:NAD(P)H-dependent oxidoreductase [Verminephrobacter aporrectodeae]MCW5321980.1 flavodoxin family protein [Verminephrobacter aporrectodeae subsp. tuberculatae]
MKVLHLNASPRGSASTSLDIAQAFLSDLKKQHAIDIHRMNLFAGEMPEFGEVAAAAKMALFSGSAMTPEQESVWSDVRTVFDRLAAAEFLLINTPLWNNGTPYALKQFIDIVTQPGWAFGFDPAKGYSGLLTGRKAVVIQASGVYHEGIQPGFGSDFNMPYLIDWLEFVGIELIDRIDFSPTVLNMNVQATKEAALARAAEVASRALVFAK